LAAHICPDDMALLEVIEKVVRRAPLTGAAKRKAAVPLE
jgi:hypothetical protein